jgi:hypothetical protein
MSLENKYKDYFKKKTNDELYDLLAKVKMFIDLSMQESIAGTSDERIKQLFNAFLKLRDTLAFEINLDSHRKNLLKMEEDFNRFKELNEDQEGNSKKK